MGRWASVEERFAAGWIGEPTSGCWLWTKGLKDGYGWMREGVESDERRAHRISWKLHRGPIPEGLHVLHKCDTRPCVNPWHLFLGVMQDNVDDMMKKGRHAEQMRSTFKCGHPKDGEFIYRPPGNARHRECLICKTARSVSRRKRPPNPLKGLRRTVSKSGGVYYYAWEGGPRMRSAYGTPEFIQEFYQWQRLRGSGVAAGA